MYLPPTTPSEAQAVYAKLHVTVAMVRLERTYVTLYFVSTFLHFVARFAFLGFGMSVAFRNSSGAIVERMSSSSIGRLVLTGCRWIIARGLPTLLFFSLWKSSKLGRQIRVYSDQWQPTLFRTTFVYYLLLTAFFLIFWSPLTWYEDFVLPHRYGLSHQPAISWVGDLLKDSFIDAIIGAFLSGWIVWGISIFPRRWAIVFACWSVPIIFAGIFLDPLFGQLDNHFTKLPASSPLYAPLHRLADRAGVPHVVILVADKSKQTEETNAYVTGLGYSAQIVLWDTLIKKMPADEIVSVTGHELGHYVEHHVIIGGVLGAAGLFVFLPALKLLSEGLLKKFGAVWKISSLADPAALPILIISLNLLTFIASPLTNAISRAIEHRADSFGLAITGDRLAMAKAMVDLANQNLEDPYPPKWEVFWLDDHPPTGERIAYALYGQPLNIAKRVR